MQKLNEFQLIQRYFADRKKQRRRDVKAGIGDDCAIVSVPPKHLLAVSIDTLIAGVHFPLETTPADIGHKALAVNLSDLAAQGATPAWVTLALTLPAADKKWLRDFTKHFFALAEKFNVELIGGDTTRGHLSIAVQAHGFIPQQKILSRNGARTGDLIYVTNTLGDAGFALHCLQNKIRIRDKKIFQRLNRPMPRVHEGIALREIVNSMIDISDGLLADLGHILSASQKGAVINIDKIPLSPVLLKEKAALHFALSSGDDYELCFTVARNKKLQLEKLLKQQGIKATCIGEVTAQKKLIVQDSEGRLFKPGKKGYLHF